MAGRLQIDDAQVEDIGALALSDYVPVKRPGDPKGKKALLSALTALIGGSGSGATLVDTVAALRSTSPAAGLAFVKGFATNGDGGEGLFWYDEDDSTTADDGGTVILNGSHRWKRLLVAGITSPRMFGAVGNGSASDVAKVNAWLTYVAKHGGTHVWQAGDYLHAGQAVLDLTTQHFRNIAILGSGANITTTGANSAFKVAGQQTPFTQLIVGLMANHAAGDGNAVAGFEQVQTSNVTWLATTVLADNTVPSTYAARLLRQSDINNGNTACFWTTFIGNADRSTGGVTVPIGTSLVGQQNATTFVGHSTEGMTDGVKMTSPSGGTYGLPSGVSFLGSWFEAGVNAIRIVGSAGLATAHGITSFGSRYEDLSGNVLSLEGATVDSNQPPYFGPGGIVSNVTGLVNNPNGLIVNSDFLWTAAGPGAAYVDTKRNNFGFALRSADNSNDVLTVISPNTGSGIGIKNATPTLIGSWRPQSGIEMAHKAENGYASMDGLGSAYTVSTLPTASTHTRGRTWVTDATATTFNSIVAGSGSNMVPVFSDGTNWRIG